MKLYEEFHNSTKRKIHFGIPLPNDGTWAEAKEKCSGWEDDAATNVHIKDQDAFYHLYTRLNSKSTVHYVFYTPSFPVQLV